MAETKVTGAETNQDYSTSEVNTGSKWINGKEIYRKTVDVGALPNATGKTLPHGITGLTRVVKLYGWAFRSTDNFNIPLPYGSPVTGSSVSLYVTGANIILETGVDRTNMVAFVTVEYIK